MAGEEQMVLHRRRAPHWPLSLRRSDACLSQPFLEGMRRTKARPNAKYVKTRAGIVGGTCISGYNPSTDQTSDPIPGSPKGLAKPGRLPIVLV
jgi:hypothetical protein